MECAFCKIYNRENALFCKRCGRQIEVECSLCQSTIPPDSKFCDKCGTSIRTIGGANSDPAAKEAALVEWIRQVLNQGEAESLFEFCTDNFSRILIKEALKITEGNRSQAARLLGLSRPTLHTKLEKYSIT